jgi:thiosulfate/3-mercaptopyruvate sulfurtransferase
VRRPIDDGIDTQRDGRPGLDPEKETIVHCWGGVRTTLVVFVLARLGWRNVRAYHASLAEWADRDDTPLVVG